MALCGGMRSPEIILVKAGMTESSAVDPILWPGRRTASLQA